MIARNSDSTSREGIDGLLARPVLDGLAMTQGALVRLLYFISWESVPPKPVATGPRTS
jgi:hypothetical protein